jgi:hypothetical protein
MSIFTGVNNSYYEMKVGNDEHMRVFTFEYVDINYELYKDFDGEVRRFVTHYVNAVQCVRSTSVGACIGFPHGDIYLLKEKVKADNVYELLQNFMFNGERP